MNGPHHARPMDLFRTGCCLLITATLTACQSQSSGNPDAQAIAQTEQRYGHYFVRDDAGRAVIFHGLNYISAAKGDPDRIVPLQQADLDRFSRDWHFNAVRHLIFWDAVEPEPGAYDDAYLDKVVAQLDQWHSAGVMVIVDMHQDVYSRDFCCDGAPSWAVRSDGLEFELQDQWFLNYLEPAVQRAWDNFWLYDQGEHADLQDHYAAMWQHVAKRLKSHPAVLGYDLMNEPHPGSLFDAAETLGLDSDTGMSKKFDTERYGPFLQRMINAVRAVDADSWLFFEPRYGGPGAGEPSYIPALIDPRQGDPHLFYFPHLYSLNLEARQQYAPGSDHTIDNWQTERRAELKALGTPLGLGEFGLDYTWKGAPQFVDELLAMADGMMASWTYWSYDPGGWGLHGHDTPTGENGSANALIRTYPQFVAGTPAAWSYDSVSRSFSLQYAAEALDKPTVISVPVRRHYTAGWDVDVQGLQQDHVQTQWFADTETLAVFYSGEPRMGTVTITSRQTQP